jgi:hypothetical protein
MTVRRFGGLVLRGDGGGHLAHLDARPGHHEQNDLACVARARDGSTILANVTTVAGSEISPMLTEIYRM